MSAKLGCPTRQQSFQRNLQGTVCPEQQVTPLYNQQCWTTALTSGTRLSHKIIVAKLYVVDLDNEQCWTTSLAAQLSYPSGQLLFQDNQ